MFSLAFSDLGSIESASYVRGSSETTGGPHITPNSLFVEQVKVSVMGKSFSEAFHQLLHLYQKFAVEEKDVDPNRTKRFQDAMTPYHSYNKENPEKIPPLKRLQVLQQLADGYIRMRNSRKGAILKGFSGRKEEGEAKESESMKNARRALESIREMVRTQKEQALEKKGEEGQSLEPSRKRQRSSRVTTTSLDKLVTSIIAWCDTGALTSAGETLKESKKVWLTRHLEDAIVALGITADEQVWLPGPKDPTSEPLVETLKARYTKAIADKKLIQRSESRL